MRFATRQIQLYSPPAVPLRKQENRREKSPKAEKWRTASRQPQFGLPDRRARLSIPRSVPLARSGTAPNPLIFARSVTPTLGSQWAPVNQLAAGSADPLARVPDLPFAPGPPFEGAPNPFVRLFRISGLGAPALHEAEPTPRMGSSVIARKSLTSQPQSLMDSDLHARARSVEQRVSQMRDSL